MAFVSLKPVAKAGEIIDPELLADVDVLQALYRDAFRRIASSAEIARRLLDAQQAGGTADLRLFQEVLAGELSSGLREAMQTVSEGTREQVLTSIEKSLATLPRGLSALVRFDAADPRAIAWAQERVGLLIRNIEVEALAEVRRVIAGVLRDGGGVAAAAGQIRNVIGLHPRWARAVDAFQEREFERLIDLGLSPESALEAARAAGFGYSERLVNARALTIARTEVIAAQNAGQVLSWYQAADQGYLDLGLAEKEWVAGPSGWKGIEVCEQCQTLNGQRVPVTSVFPNGEVMPPAHPNCRCTLNLIPLAGLED